MLTEEHFIEISIKLKGELDEISSELRILNGISLSDERLLPLIEQHLEDKRLCICSTPVSYGELRWIAAEALVKQWEGLRIDKTIELTNAFKPLTIGQIHSLKIEHGVDRQLGLLDSLNLLLERDKLHTYKRVFAAKIEKD